MSQPAEPPPPVIQPRDANAVRLVQITDCHILAAAGERLRGLDTRRSLEEVCRVMKQNDPAPDLLLATGDLSQDGSRESYDYLAGQLDALGLPSFWLPGNHDDTIAMKARLVGRFIDPAKQILAGDWLIVMLDSTVAGEVHGRVGESGLEFMDAAIHRHPDRHVLVCLHHQAQEVGSRWIDQIGLHDGDRLRARIARHERVRGVLWGHVHQAYHASSGGIEWLGTPSTCIQFKPESDDFALDDSLPGYRRLRLGADGSIETSITRVDAIDPGNAGA